MVIETNFSDEMLKTLANMKGKTFKSFECALRKGDGWMSSAGNVRFNLGQYAIDLRCFPHDVVIRGELEEMPYFTCEKVPLDSEFVPYVVSSPKAYMVGERVTGVDVVRDSIEVTGDGEDVRLDLDVALAIRTSGHAYTFSRGIWFDEEIDIAISDGEVVIPYTVEECDDDWTDDPEEGSAVAKTTRTMIRLA